MGLSMVFEQMGKEMPSLNIEQRFISSRHYNKTGIMNWKPSPEIGGVDCPGRLWRKRQEDPILDWEVR